MSTPEDRIAPPTGDGAGSPRTVSGGTLLAVFAVNLLILAYAVWVTRPADHGSGVEGAAVAAVGPSGVGPDGATDARDWIPSAPETITRVDLPAPERVLGAFVQHCSACHGQSGRGDGPAAEQLYPKPRDFVDSPFRFASTGGTRSEIVTALERTISDGVPRSAMPGFHGVLSEAEIAGLARYVLELREAQGGAVSEAIPSAFGQRPPVTDELLARGAQLYTSLACNTCHGEGGRGDGPASLGLVDSIGRPVKPADFATGLFKSGQGSDDIARTIARGVPGTPMTPYEAMLVHDLEDGTRDATDVWALVSYVQGFTSRSREIGESSGATIRVTRASDDRMLSDPAHPGWLGVDYRLVSLRPLWQRHEETDYIWVRSTRSDDELAICLEWRDPSLDVTRDHGTFPDAAAVMFALGDDVPALPMGVRVEGYAPVDPVNIWHWRAERQLDAATARTHVLETIADRTSGGTFVFAGDGPFPETASPCMGVTFDGPASAPESRAATAVGNELADPELIGHSVLEANALGFGSLALQPRAEQDVFGTAAWSNGTWRVVMRRPLKANGADDAGFERARIPIAIAVWDGAKGDHAGVKLVSGWHWLEPGAESGEER